MGGSGPHPILLRISVGIFASNMLVTNEHVGIHERGGEEGGNGVDTRDRASIGGRTIGPRTIRQ